MLVAGTFLESQWGLAQDHMGSWKVFRFPGQSILGSVLRIKMARLHRPSVDSAVEPYENQRRRLNDKALDPMQKKSRLERLHGARQALIALSNGLIDSTEMANRLGVAPEVVSELVYNAEILSVDVGGVAKYPARQLSEYGGVLVGLSCVLQKLRSIGIDGWMALDILCSGTPKFQLSPFELLEQNRVADALQEAAAHQNQGCP